MAIKHPYVASPGPLLRTIGQLRKSFPKTITTETLQKLGLAPKNESYVLNTLRFLALIGDDGNKIADNAKVFLTGDKAFSEGMAKLVKAAYSDLFEVQGDEAWSLSKDKLKTYFRQSDSSTETVGARQASTFTTLAGLSGHAELPKAASTSSAKKPASKSKAKTKPRAAKREEQKQTENIHESPLNLGLSVRVEVNLPSTDDQSVYDKIFKSIRENLIDGR